MPPLLSRRELAIWAGCVLVVALILVVVGFTSDDPDSALYADLSARLAAGPPSRWIAPEWWGNWDSQGLFREHPAGVFLLPTMLGAAGVPGIQAAYIVGIIAGLLSVILIATIGARLTSRADGRALLLLLQLMPLASIFRIRANHEYPMLVCLLVAILGLDAVRRSWRWAWVTPVALTAALLVKGVFVAVPIIAVGWWLLVNPARRTESVWRPVVACVLSVVLMGAMAIAYDAAYLRVTGESFWGPYAARQLEPLTIATPVDGASRLLHHLGFYALRLLWHPAPWSFVMLIAVWQLRRSGPGTWRALPASTARGLVFALACAASIVLLLVPASRFAERYIFSANYMVAAVGIVVAVHQWPTLRRALDEIDRRVPAAPALLWLLLMVARLVVGPYLPRISG